MELVGSQVNDTIDQEARSILVNHYGSQLRHWSNVLFTLGILFFAIVRVIEFIKPDGVARFLLSSLAAAGVHAVIRMLYFGRHLGLVPIMEKERTVQSRGLSHVYLTQLELDVHMRSRRGYRLGRLLWAFSQWYIYIPFSVALVLSLWSNWDSILNAIPELKFNFFGGVLRLAQAVFSCTNGFCLLVFTAIAVFWSLSEVNRAGQIGVVTARVSKWAAPLIDRLRCTRSARARWTEINIGLKNQASFLNEVLISQVKPIVDRNRALICSWHFLWESKPWPDHRGTGITLRLRFRGKEHTIANLRRDIEAKLIALENLSPDFYLGHCTGRHGDCREEYDGEADDWGVEGWELGISILEFASDTAMKLVEDRNKMGTTRDYPEDICYYADRYVHLFLNDLSTIPLDEADFLLCEGIQRTSVKSIGMRLSQEQIGRIRSLVHEEIKRLREPLIRP